MNKECRQVRHSLSYVFSGLKKKVQEIVELFLQQIPYLRQQLLVFGWCRWSSRGRFFFLLKAVHGFDQHKNHQCNDQKINRCLYERAIVEGYSGDGLTQFVYLGRFQGCLHIGKINASEQQAQGRHDHIIDQRSDYLSESATNDNTDGHVHHIALYGKFLEFFYYFHFFYWFINTMNI